MATRLEIATLYSATLNRAADANGLNYWISDGTNATTALTSLEDLASAMTNSAEYTALYSGLDRGATINAMYSNLFNRPADTDGLAYWLTGGGSTITMDHMIIALINGAQDTAAGNDATTMANKGTVSLAYADAGLNDVTQATTVMSGVDDTDASVTAAEADVTANLPATFSLTTSDDSKVGTTADDVIDASTVGTLGDNDVILDSTTTDNDILRATVTSSGVKARLQDIENVNITGKYVTTGFDLQNTSGTKTLTVSTELAGGTATVSNANSINAEKIVAGTNVATLNVSSLASGTRDTVTVDAGSANTTLTGNAGGADKYDVTLAANKTLTLSAIDSAGDAVSVNAAGDFILSNKTGTNKNLGLTITNDAANPITVTKTDGNAMAKTVTLAGNGITIDAGNGASVNKVAITSSASNSTIKLSATTTPNITAGTLKLNKAVVGNVDVAADIATGQATTLTVNEGSQVVLSKDTTATNDLTLNVDNANGDFTATGSTLTGTLLLDVNASQTQNIGNTSSLKTGAQVDTLLLKAGALADDANGNHQIVTVAKLNVHATTDTTVIQGANDLTISTFTGDSAGSIANSDADLITATGMTGNLTISAFTQDAKVYAGSGDDSITTKVAKAFEIHGGAGNDTIDLNTTANASAGSKVYGDAGNDTIKTSTAGSIVDGGTGNDTIVSNGTDTVTLGDGADTFKTVSINNASTISDFTLGTDTIVLQGTLAGNLDLTNMSQTSSQYDMDGDGHDDNLTLTGVTATDLSNSVQLDVTVNTANTVVVAGSLDDTITNTDNAATITTGAGADTVVVGVTGTTVKDFTTGTDKIVDTTAAADADIDLSNVTPDSSGAYKIDGTNSFTLTGHTETDLRDMVQLGDKTTAFSIDAITGAKEVNGSHFDDYIDFGAAGGSGHAQTVGFIDNGGVDTLKNFKQGGADKLSFDKMTGITATTGTDETTATAKVADAVDGSVYVLDGSHSVNSDTIDFSVIGTNVNNSTVTYTSDSFVDDVAGYINNVLGTTTGEHYIVAVEGGNVNNVAGNDTLLYKVDGHTGGITSADLTLVGLVDDVTVTGGTGGDIA